MNRVWKVGSLAFLLAACDAMDGPSEPLDVPLPLVIIAPEGVSFGHISQACSRAERSFCVDNRSSVDVEITSLEVVQDGGGNDFSITDVPGTSINLARGTVIAAGARFCFDVVYEPEEPGIDHAFLELRVKQLDKPVSLEIGGSTDVTSKRRQVFAAGAKVDFLIVLDNSPAMLDVSARVAASLEDLFDAIDARFDYRIAVTTGDPNALGLLLPYDQPGLQIVSREAIDPRGTFISNIRPAPSLSDEPRLLESAFRAFSLVGFDPELFLRPDAHLALMWISDRDDRSPGPVDLYAWFFGQLKENRMGTSISSSAFISTSSDPFTCFAVEPPPETGLRYIELGNLLFPAHVDSLCNPDWTSALFRVPGPGQTGFYMLAAPAVLSSINVTLRLPNGDERPASNWRYEPMQRLIIFDIFPPDTAEIIVEYEVDCG